MYKTEFWLFCLCLVALCAFDFFSASHFVSLQSLSFSLWPVFATCWLFMSSCVALYHFMTVLFSIEFLSRFTGGCFVTLCNVLQVKTTAYCVSSLWFMPLSLPHSELQQHICSGNTIYRHRVQFKILNGNRKLQGYFLPWCKGIIWSFHGLNNITLIFTDGPWKCLV